MTDKELKYSMYCFPSAGLRDDKTGTVHFTVEGYNLLVELLEEKALQKLREVAEK